MGVDGVSLNEICRRAKVSKPGLYREFGNEDGLMKDALVRYAEQALKPMYVALADDVSFSEGLEGLIAFAAADHAARGNPAGCLFVDMSSGRAHVGPDTQAQLDQLQDELLSVYATWVERSKARGEFPKDISTQFAAAYINAQLHSAMSQQARGENAKTIRGVLGMAFSVFD
jgi:AcrR family transcriptional regulator